MRLAQLSKPLLKKSSRLYPMAKADMMGIATLRISDQSERELEKICEIPPDNLKKVIANLGAVDRPIISPKALRVAIGSTVGDDAGILVKHLVSLVLLYVKDNREISDIVDALRLTLSKKWGGEDDERMKKWLSIEPDFKMLMTNEHVIIAAKSFELAGDFENSLHSTRIISDIRPVFNQERTAIIGEILCSGLRLDYYNGSYDRNSISIAMSEEDIKHLSEECVKAINKIEVEKKVVKDTMNIETYVSGENIHDFT